MTSVRKELQHWTPSTVGKLSRTKGHAWEREVAGMLRHAGDPSAARNLEEVRYGNSGDIICDRFPLIVQCKTGKRPPIYTGLAEAIEASKGTGKIPMLVAHRDAPKPFTDADNLAVFRLDDIIDLFRELHEIGHW